MEDELEKGTGSRAKTLTAADIQMSFVVEASAPRAAAGAIRARSDGLASSASTAPPAYNRALVKGGLYELLR